MPDMHLFFLNFYGHPTVKKYQSLLFEYQDNLARFIPVFAKQRYGVDIKVETYWPNISIKTIEGLEEWDSKGIPSDRLFDDTFQMYVVYDTDIDTKTRFGINYAGRCMTARRGQHVSPTDFMFAEMQNFDPTLPLAGTMNPYRFYIEFSRLMTHELEHRLMAWKDRSDWIISVDAHHNGQLVEWDMRKTDSFGNPIKFYSQQDPQKP